MTEGSLWSEVVLLRIDPATDTLSASGQRWLPRASFCLTSHLEIPRQSGSFPETCQIPLHPHVGGAAK